MHLRYAVIADAMILVFERESGTILDRISLNQDEDFIKEALLEWEEQAKTFKEVILKPIKRRFNGFFRSRHTKYRLMRERRLKSKNTKDRGQVFVRDNPQN